MKTNSEIVKDNIEMISTCCSHQVRKYDCPREFYDDVVQEVALTLLEYDNEKLNRIVDENHLNAFVSGILVHQLYSTNSQFYRTYRRLRELSNDVDDDMKPAVPKIRTKKEPPVESLPYYLEDFIPDEDNDDDETLELKERIMKLSPGERNIFLSYCENNNISSLARMMKCPPALLTNYLNNVKKKLKGVSFA